MTELRLWTNGYDTIVAESAKEAVELMLGHVGVESLDEYTDYTENEFELHDKQGDDELGIITEDDEGKEGLIKKTVREWIAKNGKGFLCSTEY